MPRFRDGAISSHVSTGPVLHLYPNPSPDGSFFFGVANVLPEATDATIEIHDNLGRQVMARTMTVEDDAPEQLFSVDRALPAGLYLVRLTAAGTVVSERLIVR